MRPFLYQENSPFGDGEIIMQVDIYYNLIGGEILKQINKRME